MRKLPLIVAAQVLALTACGPVLPSVNSATAISDKVLVPATQALIVAHNAYQGATAAAEVAVQQGKVKGDALTKLGVLNDRAFLVLSVGDRGQSEAQRAAEIMDLTAQMYLLIRGS